MRSASRIIPAQVPSIGVSARAMAAIGSRRLYASISRRMVVDSPPGRISASRSTRLRGRRTSTGSAPTSRIASTCWRTAPWRASTPIRGFRLAVIGSCRLPASDGEPLLRRDLAHGLSAHRLTEAGADLDQDLRIVVMRCRLDDRRRVAFGVGALEDAATDEDRLRAE